MKAGLLTAAFTAAYACVASAQSAEVRAAFERAAGEIVCVDASDLLCGRLTKTFGDWHGVGAIGSREATGELLARDDALEDVVALLDHADPRVRSLALMKLYDRGEPRLLPLIAARRSDPELGMPSAPPLAIALIDGKRVPDPRTVQLVHMRVGDWAEGMVGLYLRESGVSGSIDFDTYWDQRREREHCAGWLGLALLRARGCTWSGPRGWSQRHCEAVAAVRALVDALPPVDRALLLLWLPDVEGSFSTPEERLAAARFLGRERLLELLARDPPTDDPDLRGCAGTSYYPLGQVVRYVLEHARELLAPTDVPRLVELGQAEWQRRDGMRTALWRIAAAALQPSQAREHLEASEAWNAPRYAANERALLLVSAFDHGLPAAWIAERFYARSLEPDFDVPPPTRLLDELAREDSQLARDTLRAIVQHPCFERDDFDVLAGAARAIDAWVDPDPFGRADIVPGGGPWLASRLRIPTERRRAEEAWPDAVEELVARMASLREQVRASMPLWESTSR
jgi:hypothetical protein